MCCNELQNTETFSFIKARVGFMLSEFVFKIDFMLYCGQNFMVHGLKTNSLIISWESPFLLLVA